MTKKVLEVNVDDLHSGGVFSLVRNVIINNKGNIKIDIGAIEKFENSSNIDELKKYGSDVIFIGFEGSRWRKQIECYKNLKNLLDREQYEYVHIHADVAYKMVAPGLAAKRAGTKKIILHSHAAGVDGNHRDLKRILHKITKGFLKYLGTRFVACSSLAAEWMFSNVGKNEIEIINNGVDLDLFRYNPAVRSKIRRELGIDNELLLGHVGRFAYQKNHPYLIKVMKRVRELNINAKLILVGEGPDEEKVRHLVNKNGLKGDVIFYGTSGKVNELFQAMDIFLLPSHFEGLPIVGVEAQAAGLPVLLSDQITREAKVIRPVEYLPIEENNINRWVEYIRKYSKYNRVDTYTDLKVNKFSIQDTVNSFLNMYK